MLSDNRQAVYAAARARYGTRFGPEYHHYSEGLFLEACGWLREGSIGVDAGCYLADHAVRMSAHVGDHGRVFTFEPDPRMKAKAAAIIADCPTGQRISLNGEALSDHSSAGEFIIVNEIEGHSGLRERSAKSHGREVTRERTPVRIVTLDAFLAEQRAKAAQLRLIKFDLEGGEMHAFRGAAGSIDSGRPLILFEYGNLDVYEEDPGTYISFFDSRGYRLIDSFGHFLRDAEELHSRLGWNLYAAPSDEAVSFVQGLIEPRMREFLG